MSFQLFSAAGAWVWDQFGKDITEKAFAGLKEKWREFRWQDAAQKYRERVRALYSTTRILGNPTPIVLKNIFTDVYILDKLTAVRRFDVEQIQEIASRRDGLHLDTERFHALRIVDETDRLLVLGKPGAGKTTFLKYIALLATETDGAVINKIPIFVSLKELVDSGLDLMPFMARQFEICAFPDGETFIKRILESGQAILLFDGLDEVNEGDNQRANLTAKIINFANQYFNCKCLITCRIAATDYAFDQFRYAEVADFDDKQIQSFATNWYKDSETKRDAFLKALYSPENEGLRELGRTPLLLALLCLAFDETMNFPQRHAELYEEALDALLKKWDSSRNIRRDVIYRSLSLGRKRQLLARIAAEEFEKGKYIFKQHELAKFIQEYFEKLPAVDVGGEVEIDGEVILKSIEAQHGIFVERAHRLYSFSHLTFEEYFTARNIVDNASNGALDRLIADHLTDSRWHEVFLLTASLLDNADSFFRSFREAIDNIIRDDENLVKVIRWANVKATTHYARVSSPAVARAVALDIDIDRERARLDANARAVRLSSQMLAH